MPGKRKSEGKKRNATVISSRSDGKRARLDKHGHFTVNDLRAELPFSNQECLSWFSDYSETSPGGESFIGPEGMQQLCQDLGLDPEDIVMLAIAWKLKASQMGYFQRSEWLSGMQQLQCDNCEALKRQIPNLRKLLGEDATFKSIYQYSFDFAKEITQRNLDIDMGKAMLKLLLHDKWALIEPFLEFLNTSKYKVLNRDQWNNILEFIRSIKSDLSNYDINGAWPVMLDEFVEVYKAKMETRADE